MSQRQAQPNVLMIIVDQLRFQPQYGDQQGFVNALKNVLNFDQNGEHADLEGIDYDKLLPSFAKLRQNAVVFNQHRIASSACVASRATIFTGQYGTVTGVTQTDGIFKEGAKEDFPWLEGDDFPTLVDWMQDNGYRGHYFGKWHICGEETQDLIQFGFDDWELSYPDPHGSLVNNLGYYRDYQFEDLTTGFLCRQGIGYPYSLNVAKANGDSTDNKTDSSIVSKPWFAVSSFANPHEIASYPGLPSLVCDQMFTKDEVGVSDPGIAIPPMLKVPSLNTLGEPAQQGSMKIMLNAGYADNSKQQPFPQNNAYLPPKELVSNNKPKCQEEYRYKMGLALGSITGLAAANDALHKGEINESELLDVAAKITSDANKTGIPFLLSHCSDAAQLAFLQYYGYLIYEVDKHIHAVLEALEESGQDENTIVMFCADHGELGAAHGGMMEKWHSAYEEVVHVPMLFRLPEYMREEDITAPVYINQLTSHVDILPTILGLTRPQSLPISLIDYLKMLSQKPQSKVAAHKQVLTPVGSDLSALLKEAATLGHTMSNITHLVDDSLREGILFITYDTITEPLDESNSIKPCRVTEVSAYDVYNLAVEQLINQEKSNMEGMTPSSLVGPNQIHCVMQQDSEGQIWKFVRYFQIPAVTKKGKHKHICEDPQINEYELYQITNDPIEHDNLLKFDAGVNYGTDSFSVNDVAMLSSLVDKELIVTKANEMMLLMQKLEQSQLTMDPLCS
ncbi:sulfatase-like hydrolase/transferase [uncultured Shewanella sp.]|uniref:sulfatase-like hydrolase/transferase n=1 Tax=uncultured Shewanella sp. TaxID=173975 RepID=UPI002604DA4E|nr:sulfatase-like hydrolase/transferase [uncultured Shewanella sp.]